MRCRHCEDVDNLLAVFRGCNIVEPVESGVVTWPIATAIGSLEIKYGPAHEV